MAFFCTVRVIIALFWLATRAKGLYYTNATSSSAAASVSASPGVIAVPLTYGSGSSSFISKRSGTGSFLDDLYHSGLFFTSVNVGSYFLPAYIDSASEFSFLQHQISMSSVAQTENKGSFSYNYQYSSNLTVTGTQWYSNFSVQKMSTPLLFGVVDTSISLNGGVLGLSSLDKYSGYSTFIGSLAESHLIASESYSASLTTEAANLYLGGYDSTLSGQLSYISCSGSSWIAQIGDIYINDMSLGFSSKKASFQTAQPAIFMPSGDASLFHSAINGSYYDSNHNAWFVPCDSQEKFEVQVANIKFLIPSSSWIYNSSSLASGGFCPSLVVPNDDNGGEWIYGVPFFLSSYVHFDIANQQIGFSSNDNTDKNYSTVFATSVETISCHACTGIHTTSDLTITSLTETASLSSSYISLSSYFSSGSMLETTSVLPTFSSLSTADISVTSEQSTLSKSSTTSRSSSTESANVSTPFTSPTYTTTISLLSLTSSTSESSTGTSSVPMEITSASSSLITSSSVESDFNSATNASSTYITSFYSSSSSTSYEGSSGSTSTISSDTPSIESTPILSTTGSISTFSCWSTDEILSASQSNVSYTTRYSTLTPPGKFSATTITVVDVITCSECHHSASTGSSNASVSSTEESSTNSVTSTTAHLIETTYFSTLTFSESSYESVVTISYIETLSCSTPSTDTSGSEIFRSGTESSSAEMTSDTSTQSQFTITSGSYPVATSTSIETKTCTECESISESSVLTSTASSSSSENTSSELSSSVIFSTSQSQPTDTIGSYSMATSTASSSSSEVTISESPSSVLSSTSQSQPTDTIESYSVATSTPIETKTCTECESISESSVLATTASSSSSEVTSSESSSSMPLSTITTTFTMTDASGEYTVIASTFIETVTCTECKESNSVSLSSSSSLASSIDSISSLQPLSSTVQTWTHADSDSILVTSTAESTIMSTPLSIVNSSPINSPSVVESGTLSSSSPYVASGSQTTTQESTACTQCAASQSSQLISACTTWGCNSTSILGTARSNSTTTTTTLSGSQVPPVFNFGTPTSTDLHLSIITFCFAVLLLL